MVPSLYSRLPLARHEMDRDVPARLLPDAIASVLAEDAARLLLVRRGEALVADGALRLLRTSELSAEDLETAAALVYLGRTLADEGNQPAGTPIVAVSVTAETAESLAGEWGGIRTIGHSLSVRDSGLLAQALALSNWHASHGFSPRTGEQSVAVDGGWVRRAGEPSHEIFPRIDPSVIVAVLDADDRILLGSNAMWDSNRFSLLAGFVEPGESLEGAIEREIFEESGINVVDAEYVGSQPWPMPASLMLGFFARVDPNRPSALTPDGEEILDLRWFSREQLLAALDEIVLPSRSSIARVMIEHWYGEPLADGAAVGIPR